MISVVSVITASLFSLSLLFSRFHCLKLFVATTLLMCTKLAERSRLLHKWIVVASHLKGIMGNLFSFAAVVDGLLLEQVCDTRALLF